MLCEKVYILKSTHRWAKGLRGFAEGMFLGGGGARPGGKLCWLAPPLFCCCCWIWSRVSRKWTAGKTESKKTECFLLSGLVHENYRPNKMIIMGLERFFLNLWVKRESKRPLKASFQEVEQLLMVVVHQIQQGPKSRLWVVKNICLSLNIPIVQNYMKQSANKTANFWIQLSFRWKTTLATQSRWSGFPYNSL